jgi:hypothetical protein
VHQLGKLAYCGRFGNYVVNYIYHALKHR